MIKRWNILMIEFGRHLPYTFINSMVAMLVVWLFGTFQQQQHPDGSWTQQVQWTFHVLHPMHICLSAIATTSVFWRYERKLLKALTVGFLGTIVPCGLSDYFFPFVGGTLLGQPMQLHVCLVEHPLVVLPFLMLGIVGGLLFEERMAGGSVFSHGAHVFVSSVASLLYLVSFGFTAWMTDFAWLFPVFLVVVLAVWVPCCISDIVVPIGAVHDHAPHHGAACRH